jgi:hypothetical protein
MASKLDRRSLVAGLDGLFKSVELQLPCVIAVRNFDVYRVIKQLAISLGVSYKFWMKRHEEDKSYYAILHSMPISGIEIERLVDGFERE